MGGRVLCWSMNNTSSVVESRLSAALLALGKAAATDLVRVEDLQEGFVDVRLALEAVLDFVDVVDGMVELHRLVVLNGWPGGGPAEWWVKLHGRGARRGVCRDGRIALTAWCQRLGLKRLKKKKKVLTVLGFFFYKMLDHKTLDLF